MSADREWHGWRAPAAALTTAAAILAGATVALGQGAAPLTGGDGPDRLVGGPGPDTILGNRGPDRLEGGAGNDTITGGPGYDTLLGGPGDDRLTDGSQGPDLLDGGAGGDVIRSAPRGMDRVRCGPGDDRVEADARDIVGTDCETVDRPPGPLFAVRSLEGVLLGQTSARFAEGGPLRLLWAAGGNLFFSGTFRGSGFCFISATPSVATSVCSPRSATHGSLFVRGSRATGFRWFAFTPPWGGGRDRRRAAGPGARRHRRLRGGPASGPGGRRGRRPQAATQDAVRATRRPSRRGRHRGGAGRSRRRGPCPGCPCNRGPTS